MLPSNAATLRRAKPLLGTIVDISLSARAEDEAALPRLMAACFDAVADVHARMSFFDLNSEIGRLNDLPAGEWVRVSGDTWSLLKEAMELYHESAGAFDVMFRDRAQFPGAEIRFLESGEVARTAPARVDLGGIAKGYAVDHAAEAFRLFPSVSGVINGGGDIRFVGGMEFPLHIRSPQMDGRVYDVGRFSDCAVATSVFERDGQPVSVSVVAPTCSVADRLTKVMLGVSKERLESILSRFGARAFVLPELADCGSQGASA